MRVVFALLALTSACGEDLPALVVAGPGTMVDRAPTLAGHLFPNPPVPSPTNISSTFGPRWKLSASRYDFHPGVDYYGAVGTPVYAIGPGTVESVFPVGSTQFPNGGNVIAVRHAIDPPQTFHGMQVDRVFAVYLHLATIDISAGAQVSAGQMIGTMGMTGDTDFVHLHFETRVQTMCSLPYQTANPSASCAQLGFDPHVHPFLFVGGDAEDSETVTATETPNAYRYVATRSALDLDVIETDRGTIGFSSREGLDATSLDALDNFDRGWIDLVPEEFTSSSTEIAYVFAFSEPIHTLEIRDIRGHGLRWE